MTEESPSLPVQTLPAVTPTVSRRDAIHAAVETYNKANPETRLPRPAARLLLRMFPANDEFCDSQELLRSVGGRELSSVLRALVEARLLERRRSEGRGPDTYRLTLP